MSSVSNVNAAAQARPSIGFGILLAAIGAVCFSGKAIIVKLAYRYGVDAVTLIMYRMLFALPFFALIAWWSSRGKAAFSRSDWFAVAALGFCGYYLASFLDFLGLQYISASFERLILYLNPTLVMLLGAVLFKQRLTRKAFVAMAVSYAGIALVFTQELHFEGKDAVLGAALVFASACSYAIYLVYSGEVVKRLGVLRLTGWASIFACALCIVQFFILRPAQAMAVAEPVIWLSLLNGTLCTVAPVVMLMKAIEIIGAPLASQTGMLGPLSTIAMSALILGEPFSPLIALGTVLVLAGVTLSARAKYVATE